MQKDYQTTLLVLTFRGRERKGRNVAESVVHMFTCLNATCNIIRLGAQMQPFRLHSIPSTGLIGHWLPQVAALPQLILLLGIPANRLPESVTPTKHPVFAAWQNPSRKGISPITTYSRTRAYSAAKGDPRVPTHTELPVHQVD